MKMPVEMLVGLDNGGDAGGDVGVDACGDAGGCGGYRTVLVKILV